MFSACMYVCMCLRTCVGPWLLALPLAGAMKMQNKENEEVVICHTQRLLSNLALLFWLLGTPAQFPLQPQIQVGQSPWEAFPLALKPPGQAAVLGMDTDTASSQVKPGKGKIQSYVHSLGMRLGFGA